MGSSSTTPSAPTINSVNKPLYPSSSNTNLSAKGGGLIQRLEWFQPFHYNPAEPLAESPISYEVI
jgi:hypothetical protein